VTIEKITIPQTVKKNLSGLKNSPSKTKAAKIAKFLSHCLGREETRSQNGSQIIAGPFEVNSYLAKVNLLRLL